MQKKRHSYKKLEKIENIWKKVSEKIEILSKNLEKKRTKSGNSTI